MVRNANWNWDDEDEREEIVDDMVARRRVIDLLPWADPYIAMLIASLERGQLQADGDRE
jgi:hypothetical protein